MNYKPLHNFFSIVLTVIMILPFAVQTVHALQVHTHEICNTKKIKHIHKQKVDCSVYHLNIEQPSVDLLSNFNLKLRSFFNRNATYLYQNQYLVNLQSKSSRAPPYFIV